MRGSLTCAHDGCDAHPSKGDTILRTSPTGPGQPFIGKCAKHFGPDGPLIAAADEAAVERTLGGRAGKASRHG